MKTAGFVSGVAWSYVQAFAARLITGAGFLVVGWFIGPEEFGRFALVSVFLLLAEVVCEQIWSQALVQTKGDAKEAAEAVFRLSAGLGLLLSLVGLVLAGPVADLLGGQGYTAMLQLAALCPVLIGLCAVPVGMAKRRMDFKSLAVRTMWASALATAFGIYLVIEGWGATGLVAQQVAFWSISAVVLWWNCGWRPAPRIKAGSLVGLPKVLGANLGVKMADLLESRGIELLVGALAGLAALGYFAFASKIAQIVFSLAAAPIVEVVIASVAKEATNDEAGRQALRRGQLMASLVATPTMIFVILAGGPLLSLVYGPKWLGAVLPLQLLCAAYIVKSYSSASGAVLIGRSALLPALNVASSRTVLVLLLGGAGLSLGLGPETAAGAVLLGSLVGWMLGARYVAAELHFGVREVVRPALKSFVLVALLSLPALALWKTAGDAWGLAGALLVGTVAFSVLLVVNAGAMVHAIDGSGFAGQFRNAARKVLTWRGRFDLLVFTLQLRLALRLTPRRREKACTAYLVPADTVSTHGSLGDQVLITGLKQLLPKDWETVLLVDRHHVPGGTDSMLAVWSGLLSGWRLGRVVKRSAAAFYVIGADVMDGFYSELVSRRRIAAAREIALAGIPSTITGFSYNEKPSAAVSRDFGALDEAVHVCSRDPDSLGRFERLTGRRGQLTADLAFVAPVPQRSVVGDVVSAWAQPLRAQGRKILGINVNPHVVAHLDKDAQQALARSVAKVCEDLASQSVAVVLVPHDFRPGCADLSVIDEVVQALNPQVAPYVLALRERFDAIEIKAACREMDLVFSARMHLAIGALTVEAPVCGMVYQGKFAGLFKHFGFSDGMTISPEVAMRDHGALTAFLLAHLRNCDELKRQVVERLPHVRAMAALNLYPPAR